jgi:glucose-6-phosphate isomerase
VEGLAALAQATDLASWCRRLADGAIVNLSEGRPATHMALRAAAARADGGPIARAAARLRGAGFSHIIHIGIGGSALGPALLLDALGRDGDGPEVRVVANIDGEALARALGGLDPARTGLVAVSKTFTTLETLTNLESAIVWLSRGGVADPWARVTAVTAAPARAHAAGIAQDAILDFAESVGGRYSLWSAVGLPLAVRCGWPAFAALLEGAAAMDGHLMSAPFARNAPLLAGALDAWFASVLGRPTRGIFAYDERLRLLPAYLQQLEMESNGKSVTRDGAPVARPTGPILWGGTGTDAQHAVFQLLHQGTHVDPVEFVAVARPGHGLGGAHHAQLLANCLAQGAALAFGRDPAETLASSGGDGALAAARDFAGNRPSSTLLLPRLDPFHLGALLAFYEARTFAFATLLEINPFDQWGVELGKDMARAISEGRAPPDPVTDALAAFIARAQASAE